MEITQDQINGNLLIAKSADQLFGKDSFYLPDFNVDNEEKHILKFHSSWDWLMPIVEKIESIGFYVEIISTGCYITNLNEVHTPQVITVDEDTKMQAVWQAVVEFFTWYNSLKQPTP